MPVSIVAESLQENFVIVGIVAELKLSASIGTEIKNDRTSLKTRTISKDGEEGKTLGRVAGNKHFRGMPVSIAAESFQENFVIVGIVAELKLSASIGTEIKNDRTSLNNIRSHLSSSFDSWLLIECEPNAQAHMYRNFKPPFSGPSYSAGPVGCQSSFCLMKIPVLLRPGSGGAAVGGARSVPDHAARSNSEQTVDRNKMKMANIRFDDPENLADPSRIFITTTMHLELLDYARRSFERKADNSSIRRAQEIRKFYKQIIRDYVYIVRSIIPSDVMEDHFKIYCAHII